VEGIGTVDLALEDATTTNSTGAATALRLTYTVNPANLNVAKVSGEIVLAEATCTMAGGSGANTGGSDSAGSDGGATEGSSTGASAGSNGGEGGDSAGNQPSTQTGDGENLAETGGNSATPIIAGVGGALVLGGAGMYLIRRRAAQNN
jgi:LPXTG-motif cell wall-anchored protein